ncbi:NADP-dependent oxidoreductase [Paracoccus sp. p4-l81]|uniref:NADP-dependent oxidoreductase n=1 Tax=Paracoccus sp. p4-l81 TaxID=3342806 RepID=UPI0035B7BE86
MRAYVMQRYGDASGSQVTEVADPPSPGPGKVLVAIEAAGLNPVDFKFRNGDLRPIMRPALPIVLGNEIAGRVLAVGTGVDRFAPGDRVFARLAKDGGGAFAERALVGADILAHAPVSVDAVTAAAVPLAGLTALQALRDVLALQPGQRVLISGGAGGVGGFAIQIAKWLGAHVTTTASARGAGLVRDLGADAVIDYTTDRIDAHPRDFDAGFDLIGGETLRQMFRVVKPGGRVVSVADMPEPQTALQDLGGRRGLAALFWLASLGVRAAARRAGVGYRYLFMRPDAKGLALLARLIDDGTLRVIIDRTFPLDQAPAALAYLETGRAKGKVVLTVA